MTNITSNSFTINATALAGTSPLKTYYFSINGGSSWTTLSSSSTSVSKTITGLNANTLYNIKVKVIDTSNYESNPYSTSVRTANQVLLAIYVKNKYTSQGSNNLYFHTSSLANSARDNSYRYAGANPNNYVCFGSDASSCPSNNLYRIIGVFGSQVKLIKATHVEGMVDWCGNTGSNRVDCKTWSNSYLNNSVLNSTYLNSLGSTWSNKISYTTWYTGEVDMQNVLGSNAKTAYNYEIGYNKPSGTTYAKVGLMYVSEFFYAASSNYWRYPGFGCVNGGMDENGRCLNTSDYRLAQNNNWLLSSPTSSNFGQEVLITRFYKPNTAWGTIVGFIHFQNNGSDRGTAFAGSALANNASFYRPAFNLNTNVYYTSGSGTEYDPIRIK